MNGFTHSIDYPGNGVQWERFSSLISEQQWLFATPWTVHGICQPRILEWVAFPFSRGSSQSRDQTQVSHIAGRFFTSWATRKAQEYWSGKPIPSSVDLPDPGIEPGSPELQVDSLPTELSGKLRVNSCRTSPQGFSDSDQGPETSNA